MNKVVGLLICFTVSSFAMADDLLSDLDIHPSETVEVLSPAGETKLILQQTIVKRIDEDDMTVARLIELLEGFLDGKVKIELPDSLKPEKIFLKLERVSVLTVLKVMQESLGGMTTMEFKERKVIIHGPEE